MTIARTPSLAHWGAFNALVENGRVIGCEPFVRDALPSPMLAAMPEMVHSPLRIARPAIREGWREGRPRSGADRFREVSWDEALDLVAGELTRVRGNYGDTAIFGGSYGWSSAGRLHHARTLVRRFLFLGGGCVDQIGNYSWGAAQFLLPHVIGTYQPVTGRVTDWNSVVKHTRLVIAFGGLRLENSQVTSGGTGSHVLESWLGRAKAAGIEFVVISPSRSDAPGFLDAQWLAIRPNTDTALMLALAHTLLVEQRHDAAFLDRYCTGFETLRRYLLGADDSTPKDADWASAICGIDADSIRDLARRAADTRSLITCTWSLQRAHHGEQPYWAAIALAAMLGGIGLPGGGFAFGHGSLNGVGVPRADLPGPEVSTPPNPARSAIPVARIADMLLGPMAAYEFNGRREIYPDIRLVYWAGGNPFHHHQDLNRLREAWQKPDTIIVNESWWTPTARHADIVLPATTSLERNDIGGSSRDPYVFAMHSAIEPVGEARTISRFSARSRRRLGYEEAFTEGRDEMAWCRSIYERVRSGAAKRNVELPDFDSSGPTALSSCRCPTRISCCSTISAAIRSAIRSRRRPEDRDRVADDRRLRLRGLSAASGMARARGMARQHHGRALAAASGHPPTGRPAAQPAGPGIGLARPQAARTRADPPAPAGRRSARHQNRRRGARIQRSRGVPRGGAGRRRHEAAGRDHGHRGLVRSGAGGRRARAARQP